MIGDKWYTEAADSFRIRPGGVVGERHERIEAELKRMVECS